MLSNEQLVAMYKRMLLIRHHESRTEHYVKAGKIMGSMHLGMGQEAIHVGVGFALRKEDYITCSHRSHGQILGKGGDPEKTIPEICGRVTGINGGRSGHMTLSDYHVNALGGSGIVAGSVPVCVGYALGLQYLGTDNIAVSFFGDGASANGAVHEAMTLACTYDLPIVFMCENNEMGLSWQVQSYKNSNLIDRARAYGMPGITVDGNDVLSVYEAMVEAVARARAGEGPTMIEAKTMLTGPIGLGHTLKYFRPGYHDEQKVRDPILRFTRYLVEKGILAEEEAKKMDQETLEYIEGIYQKAFTDPWPDPATLLDHVYVD